MSYVLPRSGDFHVGIFVKTTSPQIVELLGGCGLDFAVLDAEHAPFDRSSLDVALLAGRAANIPLLVRVPDQAAAGMLSVLDMGAAGVVVPHVDDAAQARAAVACCHYTGGVRSYSSSPRAGGYGNLGMAATVRCGDSTVVICQIESMAAVQAIDSIAAVPGVDGLMIGPADLALSMGLGDTQHTRVGAAIERVAHAAQAAGKVAGIFVGNSGQRENYRTLGLRWFVQGSDQSLLKRALREMARPADTSCGA